MTLDIETISTILNNLKIFSSDCSLSIKKILEYNEIYSPLSDLSFILKKIGDTLSGFTLPLSKSWLPIRNIARIIAKIASIDHPVLIEKVNIKSMKCGCDSFEGSLRIDYANGTYLEGEYKWQWTAFKDTKRSYDNFTIFPIIELSKI